VPFIVPLGQILAELAANCPPNTPGSPGNRR
jgi:hypothetical protein